MRESCRTDKQHIGKDHWETLNGLLCKAVRKWMMISEKIKARRRVHARDLDSKMKTHLASMPAVSRAMVSER